jgi:hypothetical protein
MTKLQAHTSTDETPFEHGTAPSRAHNGDPDWFRAEPGMSGDERVVVTQQDNHVTVVLSLNLQHRRGWQVAKEYAPFNLRLHDVLIHFIAEVGMTSE